MGIRRVPGRIGFALLALAGALLTGCSTLPQSPLDVKGPVAEMQTGLLMYTLWIALGIGIFVTVALLFVVFRFRARPGVTSVPKQVHGNHTLEVIWTVIPILILVSVAYPTVNAAFATSTPPADAFTVRAEGNQWWFGFNYPEGFTTANELRIPVGKPVRLEIVSRDVIHSFWVPKLAGKIDMIPNRTNVMWLQADEPGLYMGQCAEFCGDSHAKMRFRVLAMEEKEYTAWVEQRLAMMDGPKNLSEKAVLGREIFEGSKANCWACHTVDGTKAKAVVGPNLTDVGQRHSIAGGIMDNTIENLQAWIANPPAFKPGTTMPIHEGRLTPEEIKAVAEYLHSLK